MRLKSEIAEFKEVGIETQRRKFKDFLEEDRERNLLSKSGVDISKLPRRTSNIIERFQDGLSSFSSMTETNVIDNPDSLDISSSLVAKSQTTALLDERNP